MSSTISPAHTREVPDGFWAVVGERIPTVFKCQRGVMHYASGGTLVGPLGTTLRRATDTEVASWKERRAQGQGGMAQRLRLEQRAEILG